MILAACVIIAALDRQDAHHATALDLLRRPEPLRMHPVNLGEALVGPARHGRLDKVIAVLQPLRIEQVAGAGEDLARLRAQTGLRMPDCCVLAAAVAAGDLHVATFDARLARAAHDQGIRVDSS